MAAEHQAHKRIRQEDLAKRHRGNFSDSRHESQWLADKVIWVSGLRDDKLIPRQSKAILNYRQKSIFNLGPADSHRKDQDVLDAYKVFFDDMFFFGSLHKRCSVRLSKKVAKEKNILQGTTTHDTAYDRGYLLGVPIGGGILWMLDKIRDKEKPLEVEIKIFRVEDEDRPRRLRGYLSTLLHEMCHAFLDLWGCRYDGCFNVWEKQGVKGHGHAWQDIALAVETAAADESHMKLNLDLGCENSLAVETVYERMPAPSDEELARWRMKQAEIDRIRELVVTQNLIEKVYNG